MGEERRSIERRREWTFEITDQGWLWVVRHPGGRAQRADAIYDTLKQAADAASEHGYGQWRASERRVGDRRDMHH
jgi:hypothetical protein